MKFRFRLQKVLQLAELREDAAGKRLLAARMEAGNAAVSLQEVREEFRAEGSAQTARLRGKLDFAAIIAGKGRLDLLQARVKQEEERVALWHSEVGARRDELGQALKRRRVLEKLRERRWSQYREGEEHREMLLLDEVSLWRKGGDV